MEVSKADDRIAPHAGPNPVRRKAPYLIALIVFLGGFLTVAAFWWLSPRGQQIDAGEYQAVYLVNGQMYFGRLQSTGGEYLHLKSPYMPDSVDKSQGSQDASKAIVRVKDQLWGPEDSIAIRADQVAFWQNLRDDSKVSQAIKAKENQ